MDLYSSNIEISNHGTETSQTNSDSHENVGLCDDTKTFQCADSSYTEDNPVESLLDSPCEKVIKRALRHQAKRRRKRTHSSSRPLPRIIVKPLPPQPPDGQHEYVISHEPSKKITKTPTMREVLASIPGFNIKPRKRNGKKLSTAAQLQQTKEGCIDLETPDSMFVNTNLRALLNEHTFSLLPSLYQYKLGQLLPSVDRPGGSSGQLSSSSLNNEFFARACLEWQDSLSEGEFTPEHQQKLRTEAEKEKSKLDPWKLKHFEPIWGEKRNSSLQNTAHDADRPSLKTTIKLRPTASITSSSTVVHRKHSNKSSEIPKRLRTVGAVTRASARVETDVLTVVEISHNSQNGRQLGPIPDLLPLKNKLNRLQSQYVSQPSTSHYVDPSNTLNFATLQASVDSLKAEDTGQAVDPLLLPDNTAVEPIYKTEDDQELCIPVIPISEPIQIDSSNNIDDKSCYVSECNVFSQETTENLSPCFNTSEEVCADNQSLFEVQNSQPCDESYQNNCDLSTELDNQDVCNGPVEELNEHPVNKRATEEYNPADIKKLKMCNEHETESLFISQEDFIEEHEEKYCQQTDNINANKEQEQSPTCEPFNIPSDPPQNHSIQDYIIENQPTTQYSDIHNSLSNCKDTDFFDVTKDEADRGNSSDSNNSNEETDSKSNNPNSPNHTMHDNQTLVYSMDSNSERGFCGAAEFLRTDPQYVKSEMGQYHCSYSENGFHSRNSLFNKGVTQIQPNSVVLKQEEANADGLDYSNNSEEETSHNSPEILHQEKDLKMESEDRFIDAESFLLESDSVVKSEGMLF